MRWLLFLSISAAFLPAQEQKCRLEGQVLSIAGTPLKRATVRLQHEQMSQGTYTASSDNEGKFLFEDVDPGTYTVYASRTGYLGQAYVAKPRGGGTARLTLAAGQEMKDLVFKLTPQAMIFGKVVDDGGEPLPDSSVTVLRWVSRDEKKQLQFAAQGSTQADGTFVIGLPAGRYYLRAEPQRFVGFSNMPERPGNKKPQESDLRTYFPNSLDVASAAPVEVARGEEVKDIEIHIRRGRVFEIRGRVENSPGGPAPTYSQLSLMPKGSTGQWSIDRWSSMADGKTRTFQFKSVPPGTYVIQTQNARTEVKDPTGEYSKFTQLTARAEVTVVDRDLDNVVLPLSPGLEIRGHFKTEDANPATQAPSTKRHPTEGADPAAQAPNGKVAPFVQLRGVDDTQEHAYFQAEEDGTFRMQTIAPGVFRVGVYNLPENTYVKAIKFGGQDVKGKDLDLTSGGGGELEIVLSPNAARVTGTVRDAEGKPVPGAAVQICDKDAAIVKSGNADQNGAFDLKGLAPGEYKVFAWADDGECVICDPAFREKFDRNAPVVNLGENSHESIDATVITKDAMEAEAPKIR
jgi:protocatechuate 3,4-dioxygenase beta subunit